MTRATNNAKEGERQSTDGESRFLRSGPGRTIPLNEREVQVKLARKIHETRRSKKNLELLYESEKLLNFPALQNQLNNEQAQWQSELITPQSSASAYALQQILSAANTDTA